jgi:hypothetical protein
MALVDLVDLVDLVALSLVEVQVGKVLAHQAILAGQPNLTLKAVWVLQVLQLVALAAAEVHGHQLVVVAEVTVAVVVQVGGPRKITGVQGGAAVVLTMQVLTKITKLE